MYGQRQLPQLVFPFVLIAGFCFFLSSSVAAQENPIGEIFVGEYEKGVNKK